MKFRYSLISSAALFFLVSCKTIPKRTFSETSAVPAAPEQQKAPEAILPSPTLTLLFGGDIMAHRPNFGMNNFSTIWKDTAALIKSADFSFANIEAPVDDDLPYSSYPDFNMQHEYPEAAADAGFNVFSLVNNHSNDQGYSGMMHTYNWAEKVSRKTADSERPVYFCGLHNTKNEPVSYISINKADWKIIFCAVTEVLNRNDCREYMNYVSPDAKSRKTFEEYIQEIKRQNPCDVFILSIHAAVPEYIHTISSGQRKYYYDLLGSGVDIIWANHPHVVLERELVGDKGADNYSKLIMYANGNTISGQRWDPKFDSPSGIREYTGDGLLYKVTYKKSTDSSSVFIADTESYYITTYINTAYQFVIKFLNDDFIHYLKNAGRNKWASYISERKKIMEKTKETKTWL
jgi:poly-gamma-glutamate synthesis protein (capsule biosynthesis protein)